MGHLSDGVLESFMLEDVNVPYSMFRCSQNLEPPLSMSSSRGERWMAFKWPSWMVFCASPRCLDKSANTTFLLGFGPTLYYTTPLQRRQMGSTLEFWSRSVWIYLCLISQVHAYLVRLTFSRQVIENIISRLNLPRCSKLLDVQNM